ncbi:hypothetical protein EGJ52_22905 [Pseudomonas luteola]|nr:hypothetical protein EGJ52_22905 [Pseudomonas luteola]
MLKTRYDKPAKNFEAMVTLACVLHCSRHDFSYKIWHASMIGLLSTQEAYANVRLALSSRIIKA